MGKIIFVNATACTSGGVLTILNQFIDNIKNYDEKNIYYIFSTKHIDINFENINLITNVKGKKYLDRIKWDLFGMAKWADNNKINPDIVISLQNTGVRFNGKKQIVYLHQCLPYSKESEWNFFKRDERKLWFYKNIFKIWIHASIPKENYIVVQNNWMKKALLNHGYRDENIVIATPDIKDIDICKIYKKNTNGIINFFYPAADYKYKNHEVLLKAIRELKDNYIDDLNNMNFIFTIDKNSHVYKLARELEVEKYISFLGNITYEDVLSNYKNCHSVLFPSYIETVGLPLVESAYFGKKILVADCEYSRETLGNYKLAKFIEYKNYEMWANEIRKSLESYNEMPTKLHKETSWRNMFDIWLK
mgnify:CR=1 FL=1